MTGPTGDSPEPTRPAAPPPAGSPRGWTPPTPPGGQPAWTPPSAPAGPPPGSQPPGSSPGSQPPPAPPGVPPSAVPPPARSPLGAPPPPAGMPPAGPPVPPAPPAEPAGPPPPTGPGAVVPFTAAPRERNPRIWIGLGVVAVLVVLCCGGGIAGVFGFGAYQEHQISAAADKFLVALEDQQYVRAYRMQCRQARAQESEHEFVSRLDSQPRLESHQLSAPRQYQGNTVFEVPATLQYEGGRSRSLDVIVVGSNAGGTVGWQVCGTTD